MNLILKRNIAYFRCGIWTGYVGVVYINILYGADSYYHFLSGGFVPNGSAVDRMQS